MLKKIAGESDGESYLQRVSAAGRPDVLGWATDVLAPRVQAVFDDFSKRYGWGDPDTIKFSRSRGDGSRVAEDVAQGVVQPDAAAKLSRSRNDTEDIEFATEVLNELVAFDESFRYTVSQSSGIDGNIQNPMPDAKFLGDVAAEDEKSESGADKKYMFNSADSSVFYIYESGNKVWLDVSRFSEGNRGSAIYYGVANYAHNTGKVFIGDPAGLSEAAIVRRTTAMLSSAFRFGTTKHFEPAKEQLAGVPDKGVVPLKWSADDYKNIQSLVKTFIENLQTKFPETKRYSYDFGRNAIVD